MTPENGFAFLVRARTGLTTAFQSLESGDLSGVQKCEQTLEQAAADLRRANNFWAGLPPPTDGKLLETLIGLKSEAARIERIVDASAAFLRENSVLDNSTASAYGPDGKVTTLSQMNISDRTEAFVGDV